MPTLIPLQRAEGVIADRAAPGQPHDEELRQSGRAGARTPEALILAGRQGGESKAGAGSLPLSGLRWKLLASGKPLLSSGPPVPLLVV